MPRMRRARRFATVGLLLACAPAAASCGGGGGSFNFSPGKGDVVRYRGGVKLDVQRSKAEREGPLRVQKIGYRSVDGQRVPALFAVPTDERPLGCLIFVPGFGQPKEAQPELREGLASLRLATFSIDARNVGARGGPKEENAAIETPEGVRAMLLDTVADLRVGLDWLERRPECHSNIAVLGTSFGGTVATHLAAQDHRVKAAVLTSVGATYKQTILMKPLAAKNVPNLPDYVPDAAADPKALEHAVKVLSPYDLERWIGRIAPRPVMLINGRFDPIVAPGDALQLAAAARSPKTILYFNGGHDPFAPGPGQPAVTRRATEFLVDSLGLPPAF
jgi:pimeloyl-ACP methyl ester carboxylesterase